MGGEGDRLWVQTGWYWVSLNGVHPIHNCNVAMQEAQEKENCLFKFKGKLPIKGKSPCLFKWDLFTGKDSLCLSQWGHEESNLHVHSHDLRN